jgi:ketosteroid isomerase-like protein
MFSRLIFIAAAFTVAAAIAAAQQPGTVPGTVPTTPDSGYRLISPVVDPTITPGQVELIELEVRFAADVAKLGGKAFASWFAEDAVVLQNGRPAILGRGAITANSKWDPKDYTLTWAAEGAQMSAANDMGFTWGKYVGTAKDAHGAPIVTTGRYITVWRKLKDGTWKVAMDASAQGPPTSDSCCALPKP